jgi:broad specificity phosphatase PhoE
MNDLLVVYLIRHGRTELNAAGVLRGRLDPPLDSVGHAEAAALGTLFQQVPLTTLISSPLRRAIQTAEPIAAATGALLETDDRLLDRDYASWAGIPRNEVESRFGSLDAACGVEPAEAVASQVSAAVVDLAGVVAPGPLAIVAHDAVNRVVLARLVPALGDAERIAQRTGCWNRLERAGSVWTATVIDAVPGDGRRPAPLLLDEQGR